MPEFCDKSINAEKIIEKINLSYLIIIFNLKTKTISFIFL